MAGSVHQHSKNLILTQALDLVNDGLKLMLVKTAYTDNPDEDFVGTAIAAQECDATGYTGGFAGAGRRAIDNPGFTIDDTDNEVEFDFDDEVWPALSAGNTLGFVALIKEITNDAASPLIATDEVTDTPTNGGTITYQVAAEGMINF